GKPGISAKAANQLHASFPDQQIAGVRHGYFREDEEADICDQIVRSGADVLWLGLGNPKQEAFAFRNRHRLAGCSWIRTCGGLFDHVSGTFPRAPFWMREAGLEWLHRAVFEPRRLGKRYLTTNHVALWHLLTKSRER
ncbi:MAG: WecB/TagA/CpsF family glycosyltransferase, partial [Maritimibacter sp.]